MSRISYRFLVPGCSAKPLVSAHDRIMGTRTPADVHPQRPLSTVIDTDDLHIAQSHQQLADARRVTLHRDPPDSAVQVAPILGDPSRSAADPHRPDCPLISEEPVLEVVLQPRWAICRGEDPAGGVQHAGPAQQPTRLGNPCIMPGQRTRPHFRAPTGRKAIHESSSTWSGLIESRILGSGILPRFLSSMI